MKITRIRLDRLHNEEWFNLFTEFKKFVEKITPEALNIEELFIVFLSFFQSADDTLEQIRKSDYTPEIVKQDGLRDSTFRGLNDTVRAGLRHFDPAKRAAAEKLVTLFDHYGDLAGKPYNEETSAIYNLLQALRGPYADAAATLELSGWIDELERNNTDFEKNVLERNSEYAGKTDLKMLEIRRQTGRCYLNIVERIEALCLINGDEAFAPFIKTLNANIERYKISINRRKSSLSSKETDEKEEK
jgi:hypothetical protein